MTTPVLVTLDQALAHLNLPAVQGSPLTAVEIDLQMKIDAATQFVCDHISDRQPADPIWIAEIESWGLSGSPLTSPPPLVVLAVLELTADLYRFRGDDGDGDKNREPGYLPMGVRNLLVRYRDPALA